MYFTTQVAVKVEMEVVCFIPRNFQPPQDTLEKPFCGFFCQKVLTTKTGMCQQIYLVRLYRTFEFIIYIIITETLRFINHCQQSLSNVQMWEKVLLGKFQTIICSALDLSLTQMAI